MAELAHAEGGHDWWHVYRVWKTAQTIMAGEDCNTLIVELAALLHDIADSKFNGGDESVGPRKAELFLQSLEIDSDTITKVVNIIKNMSFKSSHFEQAWTSKELEVVQDADRLDAIGAIGIASAFNLSRAEVHGVITYYHHFRQTPPPKHTLAICHAEACQARGCRSVINKADALLGTSHGSHSGHNPVHDAAKSESDWHVEPTYCLGLCATGPALMLDGQLHAHVTPAKLEALIARANTKDAS